ncbi:hypothetical protein DL93DRAFT_1350207 [Clavulina sp. PMI_390]|nr:hypothetical protein DL93DRAFT_1350207 [Clavulina sp. PMI_390]
MAEELHNTLSQTRYHHLRDEQNQLLSASEVIPQSPPKDGAFHQPKLDSGTWTIVLLTAIASAIPLTFGILFFFSLNLTAADGTRHNSMTFSRPLDQGIRVPQITGGNTTSLSPLLLSSISSSVIGDAGNLGMALLAFHAGYLWLQASQPRSRPTDIPSPYQFFLTSDMLSHLSPLTLARFLRYAIMYRVPGTRGKLPRRSRARITPMLSITAICSYLLFSLSIGIKILDVVLHEQLATVVLSKGHPKSVNATAMVTPAYDQWVGRGERALDAWTVLPSADLPEARAGSQNTSNILATYISPPVGNMSITFLGPRATDIAVTASTIALGTSCSIRRPQCNSSYFPDQFAYLATACAGIEDPFGMVYNTTFLQSQPQILLNMDVPTGSYSSLTSPFRHNGFLCFSAYSSFPHREKSSSDPEGVPFANWIAMAGTWRNERVLPTTLCFTYSCNSEVFRATYSVADGIVALDTTSLTPIQNRSTNIAVSRTLPTARIGTDAFDYVYASHYIDVQMQNDVDTLGNLYGNDTGRFKLALSQAFSNRLLGWSAGALVLSETNGTKFEDILTLRIPLIPAGIFIGLHLLFASVVLILGGIALLLPKRYYITESLDLLPLEGGGGCLASSPTPAGSRYYAHVNTHHHVESTLQTLASEGEGASEIRATSDLLVAQRRLTDASTLLYEVVRGQDGLEQHRHQAQSSGGNISQTEIVDQSAETLPGGDAPTSVGSMRVAPALRIRLRLTSALMTDSTAESIPELIDKNIGPVQRSLRLQVDAES